MKVLIQRTKKSSVYVENNTYNIGVGLVILVGFTHTDNEEILNKMISKIINLRIFEDENELMNKSLTDVKGSVLSISQFTLYGNVRKGRRPSFTEAMKPDEANKLYNMLNKKLEDVGIHVETGIFGADMQVNINNDGPVTFLIDSDIDL